MSDTSLNRYLGQGDDAAEGAYTPVPVTGTTPEQAVLYVNNEDPANPRIDWWDGANFVSTQGGGGGGVVVQVVNTQTGAVATGTTTIPLDDSIPQNTEGDEYMTLAITPTSATNKLRIDAVFYGTSDTGFRNLIVALFQDTTASALAVGFNTIEIGTFVYPIMFTHYMTAGTTSATTFKVRAGTDGAGTTTFNGTGGARKFGGVLASSITITEIVP